MNFFHSNLLLILVALIHSSLACDFDSTGKVCTLKGIDEDVPVTHDIAKVSILSFADTKLSEIPQKIIDSFPPLEELDLSQNSFTELNFADITDTLTNLTSLNANRNNISALAEDVFHKTPKLKLLYLGRNKIQSLPATVFSTLSSLELLDLSDNEIQTIDQEKIFGNLENLNWIHLSYNGMATLKVDMTNSTNLLVFDASHNELSSDTSLVFASESIVINMAYCNFESYHHDGEFLVHELDLKNNTIEWLKVTSAMTRVRANNNNITILEINPLSKIETLQLGNNKITDISNITNLETLQVLDLSGNDLKSSIKEDSFSNLTALTHLNLRSTGLKMSPQFLWENKQLMSLDLSKNGLGNFDLNHLVYMTNLEYLGLDSNEMSELNGFEDIKDILPQLRHIGLSNNTFSCSYLQKLIKTLAEDGVEPLMGVSDLEFILPNVKGIKCIKDEDQVTTTDRIVSMDNIKGLLKD